MLNVYQRVCYPYGVPYCFYADGLDPGSLFLVVTSPWINVEAGIVNLGDIVADGEAPVLPARPNVVLRARDGRRRRSGSRTRRWLTIPV